MIYSHTSDIDRIMSRPWRIELNGALYHVLSRGNEQRDLFLDDEDRNDFISLMGEISNRKVAELFGLSYSSVSKRAGIVRKRLRKGKTFKDEFDRLNALIKV